MSNINYNIIDRITALKLYLEENILNEIQLLIGIRNILFEVDRMTMPEIRSNLIVYYNLNPSSSITSDIINYVTQSNSGINSINNLLNIWLNNINHHSIQENIIDSHINEYTNFTYGNNRIFNFFNNLQHMPNVQIPSNDIENDNLDSFNQFTNSLLNVINQTYPINQNNEDIPLVLKPESLQKLELKKYSELDNKIKKTNKKCMISLEDFKGDDIVRLLPCHHVFCQQNIDDWLSNNSYKCPICRKAAGSYYAKVN